MRIVKTCLDCGEDHSAEISKEIIRMRVYNLGWILLSAAGAVGVGIFGHLVYPFLGPFLVAGVTAYLSFYHSESCRGMIGQLQLALKAQEEYNKTEGHAIEVVHDHGSNYV